MPTNEKETKMIKRFNETVERERQTKKGRLREKDYEGKTMRESLCERL